MRKIKRRTGKCGIKAAGVALAAMIGAGAAFGGVEGNVMADTIDIQSVTLDKTEVKPGDIVNAEIKVVDAVYDGFNVRAEDEFLHRRNQNDAWTVFNDKEILLLKKDDTTYTSDFIIDNSWNNGYYSYLKEAEFSVTGSSENFDKSTKSNPKLTGIWINGSDGTSTVNVGDTFKITAEVEPGYDVKYIYLSLYGGEYYQGGPYVYIYDNYSFPDNYSGQIRLDPIGNNRYEKTVQVTEDWYEEGSSFPYTIIEANIVMENALRRLSSYRDADADEQFEIRKPELYVTNKEVTYANTQGDGATYTAGSGEPLEFTFKRNVNDEATFTYFNGVSVDTIGLTPEQYLAEPGSVIVTLKPEYMATLDVGDHTLTALFDDGNDVSVKFTILAQAEEEPASQDESTTPADDNSGDNNSDTGSDSKGTKTAKASDKSAKKVKVNKSGEITSADTGDGNNFAAWIIASAASAAIMAGVVVYRRKKD